MALLVALFQTALVFFAGRVLDEVTEEASRYILTGQAQQANMTQANFENYICTSTNTAALVSALFNCNNFMVNVQNYSDFTTASTSIADLDLQCQRHGQQFLELFAGQSRRHRGCPGHVSMADRSRPARI